MDSKLDPTAEEIRQMLQLTTEKIIDFLDDIAKPVSFDIEEVRQEAYQQSETMPEDTGDFEQILDDLFSNKIPYCLPTAMPGFMAYIPGGGLFHSALGDLIAKVTNRYVGVDFAAPFLAQIETDVIKWFCGMVGYPETSAGTLTSGGSIANLTAVICARTIIMGDNFSRGTVYTSEYSHHSNSKAFYAAGIPPSQVRSIGVDENFKLNCQTLEEAILDDMAQGQTPFMIVATAGSTNTGSIDDIKTIAALAKKYNIWLHIDAAYGGFFTLTELGKKALKGIELADSITLDPHKGLFQPYGTGAIIVKDKQNLLKTFKHSADYLPEEKTAVDVWDFSEMSLELTRPFRGLAIWLSLKMMGAAMFRETLEEKLDLAHYLHQQLSADPRWQIIAEPELSLTVFRYHDLQKSDDELNKINQKIMSYINKKARTNISGTRVDGNFVLRSCILSHRTRRLHLDWFIEDLQEAAVKVNESQN